MGIICRAKDVLFVKGRNITKKTNSGHLDGVNIIVRLFVISILLQFVVTMFNVGNPMLIPLNYPSS